MGCEKWGEALLRTISVAVFLFVTWLLLSGKYEPLIIAFGVFSSIATALITRRMGLNDDEGHPIHLWWRVPVYWGWLFWEIVKANIDVAKRIIDPRLPISPVLITLETSQATEFGQVIYANSITLTPGTVSLRIDKNTIEVHALSEELAADLETGTMDRMTTWFEGRA